MFPLILADLAKGARDSLLLRNERETNRQLRGRMRADSLSQIGRAVSCLDCQTALPKAQADALTGWRRATEADTRYRKANTERWFWRIAGAVGTYFLIRQ